MSRSDSRRVPADRIDLVVRALYSDAVRMDWIHLSPQQRTVQYDKWVLDPAIGAVLTEHMSSETARSWIKDGPMKEYARARQGAGRYARFGTLSGPTADQVAVRALGANARVVEASEGVKPFHCVASLNGSETYVAWGEAKNFRYLVWACLSYLAERPDSGAAIVITETMSDPTTPDEKARMSAVAERCSLGLKYLRSAGVKRPTSSGPVQ